MCTHSTGHVCVGAAPTRGPVNQALWLGAPGTRARDALACLRARSPASFVDVMMWCARAAQSVSNKILVKESSQAFED